LLHTPKGRLTVFVVHQVRARLPNSTTRSALAVDAPQPGLALLRLGAGTAEPRAHETLEAAIDGVAGTAALTQISIGIAGRTGTQPGNTAAEAGGFAHRLAEEPLGAVLRVFTGASVRHLAGEDLAARVVGALPSVSSSRASEGLALGPLHGVVAHQPGVELHREPSQRGGEEAAVLAAAHFDSKKERDVALLDGLAALAQSHASPVPRTAFHDRAELVETKAARVWWNGTRDDRAACRRTSCHSAGDATRNSASDSTGDAASDATRQSASDAFSTSRIRRLHSIAAPSAKAHHQQPNADQLESSHVGAGISKLHAEVQMK
jgi:hypothetical protein